MVALVAVFLLLFLVMFVFPPDGIKVGKYELQFPTPNEFFGVANTTDSIGQYEKDLAILFDSSEVKEKISQIDSTIIQQKLDSLAAYRKKLQVTDKSKPALHRFFEALEKAQKKKVRIMHYGDSQIEVDRITSYIRNELQTKFGGIGVGLFPVVDIAPKMSVNISYSENWKRYAGFGVKDSTITHNKYGPLISFSRYAPMPQTTFLDELPDNEAWIKINPPKASYAKTKQYTQLSIMLSNMVANINYEITADGNSVKSGTLLANTPFEVIKVNFEKTPQEVVVNFKGKDSPDVYALSLEGNTGVVMDNIPLRGSSGTIFTKMDKTLMANAYAHLSPDLIILQFGGNVMPYLKSEKECEDYGNWFKSQINFIKRNNPKAAVMVIGPSDMSIKEKTTYVTYPFLENVRDAMKEAALSSDCIFWDMYEVMGGKNSMPDWVNADPPLAASDYIHFTPKGAKKIAEEFYNKLTELYVDYKLDEPLNP